MIKDLIVNLTVGDGGDVAGPFAISIAETFAAHITAVAFKYEAGDPSDGHGRYPGRADRRAARGERKGSDQTQSQNLTKPRTAPGSRPIHEPQTRASLAPPTRSPPWRGVSILR